jgi:hypothetical protein
MEPEYHYLNGLPVPFAVVFSRANYKAELDRLGIKEPEDLEHHFTNSLGSVSVLTNEDKANILLVFFDGPALRKCTIADQVGVIAHEAVHVWQYILEFIGEEAPGKEMEAYSIQWITSTMYDLFKSKRKQPS